MTLQNLLTYFLSNVVRSSGCTTTMHAVLSSRNSLHDIVALDSSVLVSSVMRYIPV